MNAIDIFGLVFAIVASIVYSAVIIAVGVMLVKDILKGTSKAAKFRIEPLPKKPYGDKFAVQRKRWWGWQTVYTSDILHYCVNHIRDLSEVRNVEWVKD